ncbi:YegS/Rv2252/BmrU family lipid kinase [Oscillospiraceae bacterium CM]|nr:YegS/Rv2252/BmrU family lipid kinase [Oscillospiraceae bacterium CM]
MNPYSGRGLSCSALGAIVSLLCREGYAVTVYTTKTQTPEYIAREYSGGFDGVVCVGGDGTLSGVASGLMQTPSPPPFGYIPNGTANDMASTLALPRDPRTAVLSILNGWPTPLDIGCYDNKHFTYIAAFGAFTGVSYTTKQSAKRALGHLAYVIGGLASVSSIRPRHTVIDYDDGTLEGNFIFGGVTNSTSIAGFVRLDEKDVDLGDGLFEVILVRQPVKAADLGIILNSIINHTYDSDNVLLLHTKRIRFRFDEDVEWTRDGENGGIYRELEITNCRHALKIII